MSALNTLFNAATVGSLNYSTRDRLIKDLISEVSDYLTSLDNIRQHGNESSDLTELMASRWAGELHGKAYALGLSGTEEQRLWMHTLASMNKNTLADLGLWEATNRFLGFHPSDTLFATKGDVSSLRNLNLFNFHFEAVD